MSNILEVKNLIKRFGGLKATDNITFNVVEGERFGILGPNGAGKTTLFNQISGFIKPDEGSIIFNGENIIGLSPEKIANKGLVRTFQIVKPFKELTVYENLKVTTLTPKMKEEIKSEPERRKWIEYIADICELKEVLNTDSEMLPQGYLKKLEVAKALSVNPKVLLLDEPFAGLTVSEIDPISKVIIKANEERETTIVLIEHRLKEFMALVNRIIAIDYGEVIAEGTPNEIVNNAKVIESYLGKGGGDIVNS
ncbi:ABC transporter ATP-binding protein [Geotoga petraea]|jgi:branched-chain amino acid transport system ATP-binding protein|uniref:ABC transporter ATP-binding protein n=1 Tax=Geotoga petraea TaxID=28234 RepID=A0A1G6HP17_9BACT|nr:ABC transporter ATP-binding protein [Geotoga petraea]MDK2946398.1 branched-chain amino acid transport system ATP-binding protein [Geotoga sp.]TGG88894.1 ABC transporter ATP-binding protein [Geotoga petraea]SDB95893.1 amino acid/amide ABC transporter ATP-binding protein 1, HAAT family [Geotoga petraea]